MGIFYHPPQPPTANTAGTPPEPHVPIGTQGAQPPRYTTAVMMVAVLASWPADLEPRLARPNNQQQRIAPLTLTYGSQPTPTAALNTSEFQAISAWPQDLEPRLGLPNNTQQKIAPLTLEYGQSPQPQFPLSVLKTAQIVASWPTTWDAQAPPRIAPLTFVYGQPPPVVGTKQISAAIIRDTWPLGVGPFSARQNWTRVSIAPLTLPPPASFPALRFIDLGVDVDVAVNLGVDVNANIVLGYD